MSAVSLEDAKTHLRVTFDSDDTYITSLIEAAEAYVAKVGVSFDTPVPAPVLHAVKLLISHWYGARDAAGEKPSQAIEFGVSALIAPYREQEI
ncbi:hypothetical protein LCM4577_11090 [Mesorhizobium sp. LCM 4577]|uniref:head-tail connector protein n=1 Tax=Mesorhizobium sp. LCM 4577 TaxID=1848288 RepID=UPI0008DB183D|nr:head-tail connector protein [Mesorhizobium sp. LCM 4577]OHV63846.1 hypothetical protein LCM4577_11090 [Mesorhizobium sp. LCM 4577]